MADMAEAFSAAFGRPDPAVPPGLEFTSGFHERVWRLSADKIGAGWFRNRFLYLFGGGLEPLNACLEAWSFLVGPAADRMIVGRNGYGAIAFVDGANGKSPRLYVVDPVTVDVLSEPGLDLWRFIGRYLPENLIPQFLDDELHRRFVNEHHLFLELDLALAIKVPLPLGGKLELDNFSVENIVDYYQSTAKIYEKGIRR